MHLPLEESLPLAVVIRRRLDAIRQGQPELALSDSDLAHISYCAALCEATLTNDCDATPLRQRANSAFRGRTADLLSAEIRMRFGFDDIEPIFDLFDRSVPHGCVILGSPARVSVAVAVGSLNVIFVRSHLPATALYEVAYCLGHALTLTPDGDPIVDVVEPMSRRKDGLAVFARRFAGHLLLPASALGIALQQVRRVLRRSRDGIADVELFYLSRIFGTPFEIAARRCEDEGLIPRGGTRALMRHLKNEAGGVEMREAALGLPEAPMIALPVLPAEAIMQGLRDTTVSEHVREICLQFGLPEHELERLQSTINE